MEDIFRAVYQYGCYAFKLYHVLKAKNISHNRFMRDTETGYATMRRYARGTVQKIDLALLDRWCAYLDCTLDSLVERIKKEVWLLEDYKRMYTDCFNAMTKTITTLTELTENLKNVQRETETMYIQMGETDALDAEKAK